MFWQGIDPIKAIRVLGDAIFHVHAKDTQIYECESAEDRRARYEEVHRRAQSRLDFPHLSGTVTLTAGGKNLFPRCACTVTTTCFRSSMRIA